MNPLPATTVDATTRAEATFPYQSALWSFATSEQDALLFGERSEVWRVLASWWPMLRKPRFWCEGPRLRFSMPSSEGTLVVQDAHDLTAVDQTRLLEWCTLATPRPRIIATAGPQLVSLVNAGSFSSTLYALLKPVQLLVK